MIILSDGIAYDVFVLSSFMWISVPLHLFYGCCFCFNKEKQTKAYYHRDI